MNSLEPRVVVVSNRLPVTVEVKDGRACLTPSSGGLVTALRPLLNNCSGVWIGWAGTDASAEAESSLTHESLDGRFSLRPVFLPAEERVHFYCGLSNEVLWPLFHDLQSRCNFDPRYWKAYVSANERFANVVASECRDGDLIWVHDYHLMSVAAMLRKMGVTERTAYFHHIPFPAPDTFEKLPWREEVLNALLDFDLVGFQTMRDKKNFLSCLRRFVKVAQIKPIGERTIVDEPGRTTLVGAFPISIDFEEFARGASDPVVEMRQAEIVRELHGNRIVLGVDRLDYTKGIPERLQALRYLLASHPELCGRLTLVQVVVPSREDIPEYAGLKNQIQRLVSEINGEFGSPGWVPIRYIHRSLPRPELLALYRAADIALITPLKDGMNLVAKEYCASRVNQDGALILSEFAGAACQLRQGALLVNPYDTVAVASAIHRAWNMPIAEQRKRMRNMRACIRREDIFQWRDSFCRCRDLRVVTSSLETSRLSERVRSMTA